MFWDPIFLLFALPGILLGLYAQMKLSSTYNRYVREPVSTGLTGAEAAREILDAAGLRDMPVNEVRGHLTDHYDPRKRALFLSSENYRGQSVAAVGVAAHEAGHALQHKAAYAPLQLRMWLVPITQFASWAWLTLALVGLALGMAKLITAAVVIFGIIFVFQVVTLPVEFNASNRAKAQLLSLGLVHPQESLAVGRVLNAAALTYVAAMIQALGQLLYFVMLARGHRD